MAIGESLKRFKPLVLGAHFRIFTDRKALQFFMTQKDLSPRQAQWLDFLGEFDIEIIYFPGTANVFSDARSRIYSNDFDETIRKSS